MRLFTESQITISVIPLKQWRQMPNLVCVLNIFLCIPFSYTAVCSVAPKAGHYLVFLFNSTLSKCENELPAPYLFCAEAQLGCSKAALQL